MKKLLSILSILSVVLLFSFSKKNTYPVVKPEIKSRTCNAPTNLGASRNGTQITLSWDGDAGNYSYGGYYNCTSCNPQAVTFGGSTNSKSAVVNCVAVPLSVHFSVTANCADGSHGYSPQVFITF